MKILLFIVTLMLAANLVAQDCNLKTKVDAFDGITTRTSGGEVLSRTFNNGALEMKVIEWILSSDTSMTFNILLYPPYTHMRCFVPDSEILFKSGNKVISMYLLGDINCAEKGGVIGSYVEATPEDIAFLKANPIDAIRIYFSEGYDDFTIKKADYFIRTLKCFE